MAHYRLLSGLITIVAATTSLHCSSSKGATTDGKSCSGNQALRDRGLRGTSMPPKTVALTFDDGPGARTKHLSRFLKDENIQAAFFINGQSIGANGAETLQALIDDGHLIANHTETHRSLTGAATGTARLSDVEMVHELSETDAKITPFVTTNRFLFRPPYGDFDEQAFATLSASPMNRYVGPILWDIGDRMDDAAGTVADWDCWQDGSDGKRLSMKECGDRYVTEIKRATRGIVLMHDPYYNESDPEQLGTADMVMYIVPILKEAGFSFMRVDQVPEIAALLPPAPPDGNGSGPTPGNESAAPSTPASPCP